MKSDETPDHRKRVESSGHSERVEYLVSQYIDRLVDGDTLDFDEVAIAITERPRPAASFLL